MSTASPFHEGEQRIQTRVGVREEIEPWARRVIRPFLPEEHRAFYPALPFIVLAARDGSGRPWATILAGEPGFVSSPSSRSLRIAALPSPGDALAGGLERGGDVGLLGIELETRRRNRVNGRIAERSGAGFSLAVDQSFGNCPQYITQRRWRRADPGESPAIATRASSLSRDRQELVRRSDTFFIATGFRGSDESPAFGMDASHRGGAAGFVEVRSAHELVFPDYAGNDHFNTLGNLQMDPRAGLLFVDFERGDLLQLTGRARIDWDSAQIRRIRGARRLIHFEIEEVVCLEAALAMRWSDESGSMRTLRLLEKRAESADVASFVFASADGTPLPTFAAGQHLPISLPLPDRTDSILRTYSLSGSPEGPNYRISVKRDPLGLASRALHDDFRVGGLITAGAPQGSFTLDTTSERPVVLVGAGVGLTPLVSMLHALVGDDSSRPVWFVYGTRDGEHHPLRREVQHLVGSSANARLHVAYTRPRSADRLHQDHHSVGRIEGALLESLVPGLEADFYLCGPRGFMADLHSQLEVRGVPAVRIHSESFGPAA